jgi:hypothetical protein
MTSVTTKQILLIILLVSGILLFTGCRADSTNNVPSDFLFIIDVKSAGDFEGSTVHINIKIDANGRGRFELYDTEGAIQFDLNHMVTYQQSQVIEKGQFKFSDDELEGLWNAINENGFFDLTEDYRMAMGFSYAFIVVEADGERHIVDNIGMEVPEVRAIVDATDALMPDRVDLEYGEGYLP